MSPGSAARKAAPVSEPSSRPQIGMTGSATLVVALPDTAASLGSGDLPVLGTPRVVALCEQASCAALDGSLGPGHTSVGVKVEISHVAACGHGAQVRAEAQLTAADGRRLRFAARVMHGERVIATATIDRVVVDRARFLAAIPALPAQ